MVVLAGSVLPKCGQPQSFLKMPQDESPMTMIPKTMYLTFFMSQCPFDNQDTKCCHTCAYHIGEKIAPFAAAPGKNRQLQYLDNAAVKQAPPQYNCRGFIR